MKKVLRLGLVLVVAIAIAAPVAAHNRIAPKALTIDLRDVAGHDRAQSLEIFAGAMILDELAHIPLPARSIADQLARRFAADDVESPRQLRIFDRAVSGKLASGPRRFTLQSNSSGWSELGPKTWWGEENKAYPFRDPSTGLVYARARWYDSETGTFLTPDPESYEDSSNLYAFCGGDPVNCSDPDGRQARPAPRPAMRPVVRPPQPGQRAPTMTAPRTPTPYAPGDWLTFRDAVEMAKASRPKGAGARVFGGRTADELTEAEQIDFLAHRRRLREDAAYRAKWEAMVNAPILPQLPGVTPYSQQIVGAPDAGNQLRAYHNEAIALQSAAAGATQKDAVSSDAPASTALVPYYPPNRGFMIGDEPMMLEPGMRIDRYGRPAGTFASPEGTPYFERALPPGSKSKPYYVYEVLKPLLVRGGRAAPWFGEIGGGAQFETFLPFEQLETLGYVRKVTGP